MAEDTGQERSEQATPKRLLDAKRKGDVPRSKELSTAAMMVVALAGLFVLGPSSVSAYREFATSRFRLERGDIFGDMVLPAALHESILAMVPILGPFLFVMFLAVFIAPMIMGGWTFSLNGLKFDISKLSFIKGMQRMLGTEGIGELFKALIKVVALAIMSFLILRSQIDDYIALGTMPLEIAVPSGFFIVFKVLIALTVVVIGVAMIDMPWQYWQFARKMRMTRQEVKEENKETGGNPDVKSKVRSLQQSISQRRMLLDVPEANVVIVNPEHYAVALRYHDELAAPEVVAKGVDHMAMRIREIARASDVTIFSAPVLARALYRHAEPGQAIPTELYVAVAQVLAYVFQVQQARFNRQRPPRRPDHLDVPASMRSRPGDTR